MRELENQSSVYRVPNAKVGCCHGYLSIFLLTPVHSLASWHGSIARDARFSRANFKFPTPSCFPPSLPLD
ncbi:uncharacterized protein BO97DRAFT_224395 [Aspergillus homomorphus CBS 101889]|uniref:Uncharacterized protein n=1 Tax=Aspergillus homomorphus (strain CBS 101889) TaxID=1450537 RepID=A0A395HK41_ASPHC|nr:hypothetical protein BO97DRAFT_224395 [Aspergillus homomorphus CBS 101889]RAL08140.1 hypothetical protein BO97DRAFT_224395 [Aspergillus homomorphus CBS 101889]